MSIYGWWVIGLWLLAVLAQGAITGLVMLWLYDRPVNDWDLEDEKQVAPVYLEVRSRSDEER
jgi:hypothetical protein